MNILVTGGAGYVGSVTVELLMEAGENVIVCDNLQQGHRDAVAPKAKFINADITKKEDLAEIFSNNNIDIVMHMAAETVVEYSITHPQRFFRINIIGGLNLLDCMNERGVDKIIFSSTASVYGEPQTESIDEEHPKVPINSYGESKLMFEKILKWYGKAYGLKSIAFRYFCAAGATERVGEDHFPETHLIPNVLNVALGKKEFINIFGDDYPTPDGTCIRDFVHVTDIANAHILALSKLTSHSGSAYNLGNSRGYSVMEVIQTAQKVTGSSIPYSMAERRFGDPAKLVANSTQARSEIGWQPRYSTLEIMIESAWQWLKRHPGGYT